MAVVLLGLVLAIQGSIASDSRLTNLVDFDANLRQITDFCAEVSASTGVSLTAEKGVQDLKVDVFVDGKPVGETLDKVAKALNCEWVPLKEGYRLEMSVPMTNRERNFNLAEDEDQLRLLKLMLWGRQYVSTFFPATQQQRRTGDQFFSVEQRRKIVDPYQKEYQDAEAAKDAIRTQNAYDKWSMVESSLNDFMIGRVLNQFDKVATENFWKGEPFVASTDPASQYKLFPSDFPLNVRSSYAGNDGKTYEADYQHYSFFRFDPVKSRMQMNMLTYAIMPEPFNSQGASKGGGGFTFSSTSNPISDRVKSLPFYKDLVPWMDAEATPKKFSQTIDKATKEWKSPYFNKRRRLGDHLRWLHKATNIPIVAQADRSCLYLWINFNRGFDTSSQYLQAMMKDNEMLAMEDKGYLVARNFRYWRHRRHEAPEAIWAQFESKDGTKTMNLQDFVRAAQLLREDQLFSQEIGSPLTGIENYTVLSSYHSLRLFGALTPSQQKMALSKGISFSELGTAQQGQMVDTLIKLIMDTGIPSLELCKALVRNGLTNSQFGDVRFRIQLTDNPEQDHYSDELKDGDTVLEPRGTKRYAVTVANFSYDIGPGQTVTQGIQFKK